MLRVLGGHKNGTAAAISRGNLSTIAAGIRGKIVWLATPKADTKEHLARALGSVLVITVAGDLDRLLGPETVVVNQIPLSWQNRLLGLGCWVVIALGPALAVYFGWRHINESMQNLAVQFAVVCFVTATFSAVAAKEDDPLGSIVKVGGNVFGWGKLKG